MARFGATICIATLLVAPAWADETDLEEGDVSVEVADESATPEGAEPEPDLVSVSFSDARMGEVARFYMARLNKPVLIDDAVGDVRISILSRDQMTEAAALELVGTALRQKGVLVGENERNLSFVPLEQIGQIDRRLVPADQRVADVENQAEVIDKIFQLEHYNTERLQEIITPMLPEYAMVMSDPNTGRLIVSDAAANLRRIEATVERLDVPQANQTVEKIFPVEHGDASDIVSMLRIVIAGSIGEDAEALIPNNNNRGRGRNNQNNQGPNVVFVDRDDAPILLQADITRNWILAVAPPNLMDLIERWVQELDVKKDEQEPYMLVDIANADIDELSDQLAAAIDAMPDNELRQSVRVIPFPKSRQLLVYGSPRGRNLVESLLNELDVESSRYRVIEEIRLQHDTAENVKAKIEDLFSDQQQMSSRWRWFGGSSSNSEQDVKVTADTQRNTVTILTDPARLERIRQIIEEQWDVPIDLEAVKPKVYDLEHVDPVQLQSVLEDMFNTSTSRTSGAWWDEITTETSNPVGRLFGQFSFQALRGSNKLIVSSQSQANYAVIDDLIAQLDRPQVAGLPVVIELKHANAEDLAEQLNAMFAEANTPAMIRRTPRGLSDALRNAASNRSANAGNQGNNNQNNNQGGGGNNQNTDPNMLTFWWSQSNPPNDEQPISSLIGKPRFVPISRRNALSYLAPSAYNEPLKALIGELDMPSSQVMIRAVITEIEHDDETTLGVRLASDPSILSDSRLGDMAVGGSASADFTEVFGSGRGTFNAGLNLNVLLQLLIREFQLQIINEPRLYTADNQEAHFFDGQDVPVIVSDQSSRQDADTFNRSFEYQSVGTRLHVRPHITQEGAIDLEINLELSRIESTDTVFGNFIFNRRETTTHVTLEDGQTVVISGIVRQEDFDDVRKFPLLGDIPLVGGLFRSTDRGVRNREVIAFITPVIVNPADDQAAAISERNRAWLEQLQQGFTPNEEGEEPVPEFDPLIPGQLPESNAEADEPVPAAEPGS
ncbi:MAG: secretin N-terminal domain-containing protein [Planctomycetota bacterium]